MNFTSIVYFLGQVTTTTTPKPSTESVESGFVYVIAAFTAVWLLIAVYLFWLQRRQESLRQEVEQLRQEEAERQQQSPSPARYTQPEAELEVSSPTKPTQGNALG